MGIDVKDLPPAYQAQALRKWAEQERKKGRGPIPSPAADAPSKASKYHNKPTERVTASGIVIRFDSQKEARRYDELMVMLQAGKIRDLRLQVDFTLQEAYTDNAGKRVRAIRYKADFTYQKPKFADKNGEWIWGLVVEDVKSRATRTKQMYNKLRLHDGIILRPALGQMEALETAVQRDNPAMLEVNRAIAQATERGYKISRLRTNGLLDADACAAQMAANTAQLTQLRAKRRRLLKNDDIGEAAEALRQTVDAIRQGPERLDNFDEALFEELVEQIVVSPTALRFRLYGGIEVTERIGEDAK